MKQLKNIALIILLLFFTFCTNQRSEKSRDRKYTSDELIGRWKQVSTDESINDTNLKIESIQLVNDSVAEVLILDSTGIRKVFGKWENGYKKKIKSLDIKFESGIKISFFPEDSHYYNVILQLGEENKKTIMTSYNYKFEKE